MTRNTGITGFADYSSELLSASSHESIPYYRAVKFGAYAAIGTAQSHENRVLKHATEHIDRAVYDAWRNNGGNWHLLERATSREAHFA